MRICRPVVAAVILFAAFVGIGPHLSGEAVQTLRARRNAMTGGPGAASAEYGPRKPDVIYLPTKADVVTTMLAMARVRPGDVVYDLGSGDGRIVIAAVRDFSASFGVGVELDRDLVSTSLTNAAVAGVSDRVDFLQQDLFESDLSAATVVMLYLLPSVNQRLAGKLRQLRPGTRIVSHDYLIAPDWMPDETRHVRDNTLFLFTVKATQAGHAQ